MSKFKVGDFFRRKGENEIYQVRYVEEDWVKGDATPTLAKHCVACPESEVERVEPKTAFLEELRELLRKYDASLVANAADSFGLTLDIYINGECVTCFDMDYDNEHYKGRLTADNLMDYDKEGV